MAKKIFKFKGKNVTLNAATYTSNGTLAIEMKFTNGALYDIITVNLPFGFADNEHAYLDTNNIPGIENFIESNELGENMHRDGASGFCTYPLFKIFTDKFEE